MTDAEHKDEPIDADFEPAAEPEPAAPARPRSGPGWLGVGLIGALAAIAGGVYGQILDSSGDDLATVEALQGEIGAAAEAQTARLSEVEERLKREIAALGAASGDADALETLFDDLAKLSSTVDGLSAAEPEAVAALSNRIAALETADEADEATSPRLMNRAVTALRDRVEALEATQADLEPVLATTVERLDLVESRLEAMASAEPPATAAALAELAAGVAALRADTDRLLEGGATSASAITETREAAEEAYALVKAATAAAAIEAAARRGEPFPTAFENLRDAMPGEPLLDGLEGPAQTGAATVSELQASFADAADAIRAARAAEIDAGDDGWSWVRQAFGGAVEVRRTEGAAGDETEAALVAAENAITEGALAEAVAALGGFEDVEPAAAWLASARARRDLEDALDRLRLRLISAER